MYLSDDETYNPDLSIDFEHVVPAPKVMLSPILIPPKRIQDAPIAIVSYNNITI